MSSQRGQPCLTTGCLRLAACWAVLLACACRAPSAEPTPGRAVGVAVYLILDQATGQLACMVRCEGPAAARLHAITLASIESAVEFLPLANGKPAGEMIFPLNQTAVDDPTISRSTPGRRATDRVIDLGYRESIGKLVQVWDIGWWNNLEEVFAKHPAVLIVPRTLITGADDSGATIRLGFMPGSEGPAERGFVIDRQLFAKLKKLRSAEMERAKGK